MTRESISRLGLQLVIGVILVFPVTYFLNLFEVTTKIPVEGFFRGIVILVFCVWPPVAFLHFYEVRRRA
jgi:hypothetical protein